MAQRKSQVNALPTLPETDEINRIVIPKSGGTTSARSDTIGPLDDWNGECANCNASFEIC